MLKPRKVGNAHKISVRGEQPLSITLLRRSGGLILITTTTAGEQLGPVSLESQAHLLQCALNIARREGCTLHITA
ncbi:hypothetical protein LMH87_010629 [Akanthomyces muscarius]|uniref:Uncharacterized protein n=1 Tax=Akanthomyces muscarius TaxID=2231603 RepID=A0A9W8UM63_AKAMU|nr:hypothetical protein LMH87_010629 [Akanthomyces muscarius]KAJ4154168.1 hypothetical protein LMH87_010629 [Akanthomyces muscarius]